MWHWITLLCSLVNLWVQEGCLIISVRVPPSFIFPSTPFPLACIARWGWAIYYRGRLSIIVGRWLAVGVPQSSLQPFGSTILDGSTFPSSSGSGSPHTCSRRLSPVTCWVTYLGTHSCLGPPEPCVPTVLCLRTPVVSCVLAVLSLTS